MRARKTDAESLLDTAFLPPLRPRRLPPSPLTRAPGPLGQRSGPPGEEGPADRTGDTGRSSSWAVGPAGGMGGAGPSDATVAL